MQCRILALLLLAAFLSPWPSVCHGEPAPIPTVGTYEEHYVEDPASSTTLIVGVRWGGLEGAFDPENVRVRLPEAGGIGKVCVGITSEDGRYEAENSYVVDGKAAEPRFAAGTNYRSKLVGYPVDGIGIVVRQAPSCDDRTSGALIPAIVTPLHSQAAWFDPRRLVIDLNLKPNLVKTTLVEAGGGGGIVARGDCVAPGGDVHIAYRAVCTMDANSALIGHTVTLRLTILERYETKVRDFPLLTTR